MQGSLLHWFLLQTLCVMLNMHWEKYDQNWNIVSSILHIRAYLVHIYNCISVMHLVRKCVVLSGSPSSYDDKLWSCSALKLAIPAIAEELLLGLSCWHLWRHAFFTQSVLSSLLLPTITAAAGSKHLVTLQLGARQHVWFRAVAGRRRLMGECMVVVTTGLCYTVMISFWCFF